MSSTKEWLVSANFNDVNQAMTESADRDRPRLAILSYVGRSGSTVFATHLAEAGVGIAVIPEMRTLEFLLNLPQESEVTYDWLEATIRNDQQLLQYLTVPVATAAASIAAASDWAARVRTLAAYALGREQAELDSASAIVFKFGDAVFSWDKIRQKLPQIDLLYVHRHPCAVVNSQLNTPRAYNPKENMGRSDPWHCAATWNRHVRCALSLGHDTLPVAFDDVISGNGLTAVTNAWGLKPNSSSFAFSPAERETAIHQLINKPANSGRKSAWNTELRTRDARIVAALTTHSASQLGYDLPPPADSRQMAAARVRHYAALMRHLSRRAISTAAKPRVIAQHIRSRVNRYRPAQK